METSLQDRDRVGVQDAVLLEDYTSDAAFVDNLHKRFGEDIIYVSCEEDADNIGLLVQDPYQNHFLLKDNVNATVYYRYFLNPNSKYIDNGTTRLL